MFVGLLRSSVCDAVFFPQPLRICFFYCKISTCGWVRIQSARPVRSRRHNKGYLIRTSVKIEAEEEGTFGP